jgi:hypothetical protein
LITYDVRDKVIMYAYLPTWVVLPSRFYLDEAEGGGGGSSSGIEID